MGRNKEIDPADLEYMESLSSAVAQKSAKKTTFAVRATVLTVFLFVFWAYFAELDEITRGEGKVIPSGKTQVIQNLEGGIIEEILVKEGDIVKRGDILLKIDNTKFTSSLEENRVTIDELETKLVRLKAESTGEAFTVSKGLQQRVPELVAQEYSLYQTNKRQLLSKIKVIQEQLVQKKNELEESRSEVSHLEESCRLLKQERDRMEPLVRQGAQSDIDFLKLRRELNDLKKELEGKKLQIPKFKSMIQETRSKIDEATLEFQSKAKEEYNKAIAEKSRLEKSMIQFSDQLKRTLVTSPVEGTVKQMFVNTVGGVAKPGMELLEIVPSEDNLLIEAKIKPSDIAFLHPKQKAMVKVTAYDFSIYGGLEGKVVQISADTITEKDDESYYLVRLQTTQNYLGDESKKLDIIPGMTVSVDILTGKKTVLDYLLKPILKAQSNALTER